MGPKKRKQDSETSEINEPSVIRVCVINFLDSADQGFTLLTDERLLKLKDICKTRLALPADSKQRISEICDQILMSSAPLKLTHSKHIRKL